MGSFRQRPDLHFEFLYRFGTHPGGSVGDKKSQKLESVIQASNFRLFRTQFQSQILCQDVFNQIESLFGLR